MGIPVVEKIKYVACDRVIAMGYHCTHVGCTEATVCKGASEREDANVVVEKYECAAGHVSHETVEL